MWLYSSPLEALVVVVITGTDTTVISYININSLVSVNKNLCRFYYSISQKVITLSGRRFITVSGVLLHYRAVITLSGVFYYIIRQLLQYQAFITLSVGTAPP